jgi:hypothetical protein
MNVATKTANCIYRLARLHGLQVDWLDMAGNHIRRQDASYVALVDPQTGIARAKVRRLPNGEWVAVAMQGDAMRPKAYCFSVSAGLQDASLKPYPTAYAALRAKITSLSAAKSTRLHAGMV